MRNAVRVRGRPVSDRARALHRAMPVTDLHAHPLFHLAYWGNDLGRRQRSPRPYSPTGACHWDLPRALEGGVRLQLFTVYAPTRPLRRMSPVADSHRQIDVFERFVAANASRIAHARSIAHAREIAASGRLAAMLSVEGGHSLGGDPGEVARLRARGVRALTLVHFVDNGLVQGVEQRFHAQAPLTALGREVLVELARHKVIADVAHLTRASFDAVCAATDQLLVSTHSGVRALADLERNLADAQLDEIARRDGVVGVIMLPLYLKRRFSCALDDLADVVVHIASRVGIRHVALGTDFDGFIWTPRDLPGVEALPRLTQVLLDRGLSDVEVTAVMGANAQRVLAHMDA